MKIIFSRITLGNSLTAINDNFEKLKELIQERVLFRNNPEGEPNALITDIDANSNRIYNLPVPIALSEAARLRDVINAINGNSHANLVLVDKLGGITADTVQGALQDLQTDKDILDSVIDSLDGRLDVLEGDVAGLQNLNVAGIAAAGRIVAARTRQQALDQIPNMGTESLRIFNDLNNHVVLTNGAFSAGVSMLSDGRLRLTSAKGTAQENNFIIPLRDGIPVVQGNKQDNQALISLINALADLGIIADATQ